MPSFSKNLYLGENRISDKIPIYNNIFYVKCQSNDKTTEVQKSYELQAQVNNLIGTFTVKNITDDELNDDVIGWINKLENNRFEIPQI